MAEPPTLEELKLIKIFRNKVSDLKLTEEQNLDVHLVRWLRARDLDMAKAESMLLDSVKWRKVKEMDKILKWSPPEIILKYFPFEVTGFTPDGCPVVFFQSGIWDVRKIVEMGMKDDYYKYVLRMFEVFGGVMRGRKNPKTGLPITQLIFVSDFEHYSYKQLTCIGAAQATMEFSKDFDLNYPECMKRYIVIKAPTVFALFFNMVKPMLSAKTAAKVKVFDSKEENWKKALHELLPLDVIPPLYGGTCLKTVMNQYDVAGADIQATFLGKDHFKPEVYMEDEVTAAESAAIEDLTTTRVKWNDLEGGSGRVDINPGCKYVVDVDISSDFAILSWEFKTEFYDIGFSVSKGDTELVPYSRVNSNTAPQNGSIICDEKAKYSITFDNTYSVWREKKTTFTIKID